MSTLKLLNNAEATGAGLTTSLPPPYGDRTRLVQIDMVGTGSVVIEGRLSEDLQWFPVVQVTDESVILPILSTPQVRARVISTAGSISAAVSP